MRILIADDQVAVRSAIRRVLDEEPDLTVIAEAANLGELFRDSYRHQPDLILLDWELSGFPNTVMSLPANDPKRRHGEQRRNVVILELHKLPSHPFVIVMSTSPDVREASLKGHADAFVLKGASPNELSDTLHLLLKSVRE
ncbi:MAG TPA: response regulator transcription factor [Anaerolineales bacterium]|nr:response regulator transcription factor [Anaerolineales bacterium]